MPPSQYPCYIWQLREGNTACGTHSTQWRIPLTCSASPLGQLGHVLHPRRPFHINYPISKPALPHSIGMWPLWVQRITISGIHIMPSHLQQCYRPPKLHLRIWQHISNPWLFDPLSTFSNKQDNHYILANLGCNYLTVPSNKIIIDNYCHDSPRPQWP